MSKADDTISRKAAIDVLTKDKKALEHIINEMSGFEKEFDRFVGQRNQVEYDIYAIEQLPPAQPERFTDIEQRIFLAAMSKEEAVCRQVEEECKELDGVNLINVCREIERKVKGALWT